MHPVVQNFLDRPASHKIIAWILLVAVICGVFWFSLYSSLDEEHSQLTEKLEQLNVDITAEQRLVRNLPQFRKDFKELEAKLAVVLRELPNKGEIAELLDSISGLAQGAGLGVSLFQPVGERVQGFYAEVPVKIAVEGTFHQIATFFDEVGKLQRIVNINDITLGAPQVSPERVTIKAECVATTFRYLDENERMKAPDDAEAQKRRRR